jgi:hypothetical protein
MGSVSGDKNGQPQPHNLNATIPKKKKKGKKIVVGYGIGITSATIDQGSRNNASQSRSWKKGQRKPDRAVPPPNNANGVTGNKKTAMSHTFKNNEARTHPNNSNRNAGHTVLAKLQNQKLQNRAELDAIRAALKSTSTLPDKLKKALGAASLELNHHGEFVIQKEAGTYLHKYGNLKQMLQKNHLEGWLEWLQGRRGWILATDKYPYLDYHRDLHEAYTVKMRALLKQANPSLKKTLAVLYYKEDALTQQNGGNGSRQNTQTLWKKVSKQESLQDAVGKIRPFLEVIRYFCTDPEDKWTSMPWLLPAIKPRECHKRLDRISRLVFNLMRSSDRGPDGPVHWAAHPALNHYPRSVVTPSIMKELVVGIANILSQLFLPYPTSVVNLDGVDKMLPHFSSSSVGDGSQGGGGDAAIAAATKKGSTKKPLGSKSSKKATSSSDLVEPLVIDLTGLSIHD